MKQIFKAILCLFLLLSFSFSDEIRQDITTQDQNLTKQVDELCEAIINDDYDKVKAILDINPNLIYEKDGKDGVVLLLFFEYPNIRNIELLLSYIENLNYKIYLADGSIVNLLSLVIDSKLDDNTSANLTQNLIKLGVDDNHILIYGDEVISNAALAYMYLKFRTFKVYLDNKLNMKSVIDKIVNSLIIILEDDGVIRNFKILDKEKLNDSMSVNKKFLFDFSKITINKILDDYPPETFTKAELEKAIKLYEILGDKKLVEKLKITYDNLRIKNGK